MNERLDYLLSVAIDDELDPAERAELERLLQDDPEAAAERRASFESIDDFVRTIGTQPLNLDQTLDAGLASVRARIEEAGPAATDELGRRRRGLSRFIPSLGLAAAAALTVYFVTGEGPMVPAWFSTSGEVESRASASKPKQTGTSHRVDEPIALAVVFEIEGDDDPNDPIALVRTMTPEDFEIVEQLELLEFLAARESSGGRG